MGKEKEIDLYYSDESEYKNPEKSDDTIKDVLDERDYISPLKEVGEESLKPLDQENSPGEDEPGDEEIEMSSAKLDDPNESPPVEPDSGILLEDRNEKSSHQSAANDAATDPPDEIDETVAESVDLNTSKSEYAGDAAPADNQSDNLDADSGKEMVEKKPETEALPGGESRVNKMSGEKLLEKTDKEYSSNDFVGLDDDDSDDRPMPDSESETAETSSKTGAAVIAEKKTTDTEGKDDSTDTQKPLKEAAEVSVKAAKTSSPPRKMSAVNMMTSAALLAMIIAGFVLYLNPGIIGLTRAQKLNKSLPDRVTQPVAAAPQPTARSAPAGKHEQCLTKIADANQLRRLLLEKKDEIYELNLHYHNGIAELEKEIGAELKRSGIQSYEEAIKNTRIDLKLRTIQRRLAYIKELEKPAFWLNSGSEELFYLVRKAEVDLQLVEIAAGIDLNKHMRHISAAIQKYRPSPDKLSVDPLQGSPPTLEQIWQQVSAGREKKEKIALKSKNDVIVNQICGGNFSRIAELTDISPRAAKCLSRMKGSELFLNSLKRLSPDAAKQLFQWQGNWICLNGVRKLSEPVARHLFKWKGNWISLNSLNEFPPELAQHLLKWEGQQLELMGLEYDENEVDKKAMKYLALWETTGGKLFVPDKIRREMADLM